MEVTKSNFSKALENINSLVKEADFISFDLELTGLGRNLGEKNNELDTPAQRYQKAVRRVKEYGITQIGLSLFRYCKTSNKYLNATFCFFLAGNEGGNYRYDTSSMMFLAQNGFDFNKLFLDGLTFISLTEEEEFRKKRHEKLILEKEKMAPSPVKLKDQQARDFVESSIKKVKDSLKEGGEPAVFEGKNMNGFLRKVLFNNVAPLFPTSLFQSLTGMERNIKVLHFTSDEEKYKHLDNTWEEELSEQLCFGHVVKAILDSNKPLVGHNMILDLLHFVDKFITPLPSNLSQFKTIVKANLPKIYDTKVLARDPPFSANIINTALGTLYEELTMGYSPPTFGEEKGHQSYSITEDGQAHDGGFDAFMTGVAFITMLKTLEGKRWGKTPFMNSKSLQKYSNKINFMGSYDIPFIDLERQDVIPDRSYIFNVTCPSTFTHLNVRHVFACLKSYKTVWVSDTQLFVIPQEDCDTASSKKLLPKIRAACSPNVHVELFEQQVAGAMEDGRKQNGNKQSAGHKRSVKNDTVPSRPSSISLKRTSDAAKKSNGSEETGSTSEDVGGDSSRSLKRLKSVGSDLLSNMTLESPMSVDKVIPEVVAADQSDLEPPSAAPKKVEDFPVPDEW